mmetsp:Transcript_171438/g.549523  ORF Transcript_171438/g.549523 Transcript_171438/m.549523 type:complete len:379 (-) Transcript_171438:266-1402(-)
MILTEKDGTFVRESGVPSVPWHVTLTGLALTNMYYWSTNQVIVQRVLAAESLSNGQKGVLFAAMMKVIGFTMLCLPGIIGMMMVREGVVVNGKVFEVGKPDEVYPHLVKAVMPKWSLGFFSAVLLGSVLSTFNSALNSAATIFGLEIYKIYMNREATDEKVIKVATIFGASMTLLSFVIAPQLAHVGAIFTFLQRMNAIVSLPIVTVFFVGIATSLPDAFSAKVGFAVAAVAVGAGQFVPELQFLHLFFIGFVLAASAMALMTYVPAVRRVLCQEPKPSPYECTKTGVVDMTPWGPMYLVAGAVVVLLAMLVVSLQLASFWLFVAFWCVWFVAMGWMMWGKTTTSAPKVAGDLEASKEKADGAEEITPSSANGSADTE